MDGTRASGSAQRNQPLLWSGVAAVVVGALLLLYGAWPLGYTMELLKGPGSDPEGVGDNVDAMMAEAKARVWADVLGFLLLLAGMTMVPASKPKPRSVDEVVEEKLRERERLIGATTANAAPAAAAMIQPAAATPPLRPSSTPSPPAPPRPQVVSAAPIAPAAPSSPPRSETRRTHCPGCGSILVAGGRICPRGHPQA